MGLDQIFTILPSREEAIEAVAPRARQRRLTSAADPGAIAPGVPPAVVRPAQADG